MYSRHQKIMTARSQSCARFVRLGINHTDTSDFYGPHITNQLIKEALHPYPEQLRIVTKVGARRDAEGNWPTALEPDELELLMTTSQNSGSTPLM